MAAMGQQPLRAATHADSAATQNLSPPTSPDEASIKEIIADLRAMGERLSTATKKQIETLKLRGSDQSGPDPASQSHSAAAQAEEEATSTVLNKGEEKKLREKASQEHGVDHPAQTPDQKPGAS